MSETQALSLLLLEEAEMTCKYYVKIKLLPTNGLMLMVANHSARKEALTGVFQEKPFLMVSMALLQMEAALPLVALSVAETILMNTS